MELNIDACTRCQLRCADCTVHRRIQKSKVITKGHLKAENFARLLQVEHGFTQARLTCVGELFLNPDLLDIMRIAYEHDVALTAADVNLNFARKGVLEGLVKYSIRHLQVSIDGATPDVYAQYRVRGHLEQVLANVEEINRWKKKYGSRYPTLTWQFIVFGHNEHELPLAREMATRLGMNFKPKMVWHPGFSPIRNEAFVFEQTNWKAIDRAQLCETTGRHYARAICYPLWYGPRVNWDGKVVGCCANKVNEFGGNVFTDGYLAAANGDKISYARDMLFGLKPPRADVCCSQCGVYRVMANGQDWITEAELAAHAWKPLARPTSIREGRLRRLFPKRAKSTPVADSSVPKPAKMNKPTSAPESNRTTPFARERKPMVSDTLGWLFTDPEWEQIIQALDVVSLVSRRAAKRLVRRSSRFLAHGHWHLSRGTPTRRTSEAGALR